MSNWQSKSTNSFDAANNLINARLFNPSVHSSYYGCVQFVYHIMYAFWNDDIQKIEDGAHNLKEPMSAHRWIRKIIYENLKPKNKKDAVHFRDEMSDLFGIRVTADYLYAQIEEDQAKDCNERAMKLILLLQKHYDI